MRAWVVIVAFVLMFAAWLQQFHNANEALVIAERATNLYQRQSAFVFTKLAPADSVWLWVDGKAYVLRDWKNAMHGSDWWSGR